MSAARREKLLPRFEWEHVIRKGDHDLSAATVGVAMVWATYAGNERGESNVTAETVGEGCNLSERRVQEHFATLQDAGFMAVVAHAKGGDPRKSALAVRRMTFPQPTGAEARTSAEARTGAEARVELVRDLAPRKDNRKRQPPEAAASRGGADGRASARPPGGARPEPRKDRRLLRLLPDDLAQRCAEWNVYPAAAKIVACAFERDPDGVRAAVGTVEAKLDAGKVDEPGGLFVSICRPLAEET
jgi:hypothetical protein